MLVASAGLAAMLVQRMQGSRPPRTAPADLLGSVGPTAARHRLGSAVSPVRLRLWEKAQAQLQWAHQQSLAQIEAALDDLDRFFTGSLDGIQPFAQAVLGLEGKLEYLRGVLDGEGGRQQAYLQRQFERHIFSADELRQAMEGCVTSYAHSLEAIDNQLLVRMRADLAEMPQPSETTVVDVDRLEQRLTNLLAGPAGEVSRDMHVAAAREAGSAVAGELAAAVAVRVASAAASRLGVSGGLMAAGAGSSWASFGTGLAAAMLVDRGIDWAMKQGGYDPQRHLARLVARNLLELKAMLIEGDADKRMIHRRLARMAQEDPDVSVGEAARAAVLQIEHAGYATGLRCELEQLALRRDQVRRQVLQDVILGDSR